MSTFGERLRAAMLAAGVLSSRELAKRCKVSRQTIEHWVGMQSAELSALHLLALSDALKVRLRWLCIGHGFPGRLEGPLAIEAQMILEAMPREKVPVWFGVGRRMAR